MKLLRARRRVSLFGLGALLALTGCVDMFTTTAPADAARWRGTTTTSRSDLAECGPFAMYVDVFPNPFFMPDLVNGRAYPTATPVGTTAEFVDMATSWWIEGYMSRDGFVEFETKRQRPVYFRAKPYAVWRGSRDGDRITLVESGSPCGRELVLIRG